jgi:hypothetical protein
MPDASEHLYGIFCHPNFLAMKGLANEVPIFIHPYDPAEEDSVRRMVDSLQSRLLSHGIQVAVVDLFDTVLGILEDNDLLTGLLEDEAIFEKVDLLETLENYADPKAHLIPRILEVIGNDETRLTLLVSVGRVFPFLRTHTVLEALQPAMMRHPIVMFFPGEYVQEEGSGSQLRLFGSVPTPSLYRPYYRAINLATYNP